MSGLSFAHPWLLTGLALMLPLVLLWIRASGRSRHEARAAWRRASPSFRLVELGLLLVAVSAAIVAAAQPRWGSREVPLSRSGADVIVALDISRSMNVRDVDPSRLEAAKAAIASTIERLDGDRVGLIVFAGSAQLRFPLTTDNDAAIVVLQAIDSAGRFVDPGSNSTAALDLARTSFDQDSTAGRLVILISDGEDQGPDPAAAAARLQASGSALITAGAGTEAGGNIPVVDPETGATSPQLDENGNPIVSRLDAERLRTIAAAGGGAYIGNSLDTLPGAAESRLRSLDARRLAELPTDLPVERYPLFAALSAAALGLLVLGSLAGALGVRKRAAGLAAAMLLATVIAGCASEAWRLNEDGLDAYRRGDLDAAIQSFDAASRQAPGDHEIDLNLALALDAAGRHDEAAAAAVRATASSSRDVRLRAFVALGHHRFTQGDLSAAADAFWQALLLDPENAIARHDYEVVMRLLEPEATPPTPPGGQGQDNTPPPGETPSSTPQPGTGSTTTPGGTATPPPGATGQPGPGSSAAEVEGAISQIDAEIAAIRDEAKGSLSLEQSMAILDLLKERERLEALRDALSQAGNPESR